MDVHVWKEGYGFNVSKADDPDLLTWLMNHWQKDTSPSQESIDAVEKFIDFGKARLSLQHVVGVEYLDQGMGLVLANGERIPFNKVTSTVKASQSVAITGSLNSTQQGVSRQIDTSKPITGVK